MESEGEAWYENKSVSSSDSREDNVCNDAVHVIGLYGPGDKVSFFLNDWELAKVALSCHTLDLLCQEMHEAWLLVCCQNSLCVTEGKPFSHRGRAVTVKERDVVRENEGRRNVSDEPF